MPTLTKKQKAIFEFIEKYIEKHGVAPTLEEICRRFKKAVGTIHEHIEELAKKKFLKKTNSIRGLEIVKNDKTIEIPLKGYIAAGQPVEAIEIPSETIAIAKSEIGKIGDYYALQVKGDSMIDEGIFDGDTVIVKEQPIADDGQTVVAIIDDNEATLKKIYRDKNRVRLQPANQLMLPIYRKEVEIRGVVVKIVRNLETRIEKEKVENEEKCNECGKSVKFGAKKRKYVNRVLDLNDYEYRRDKMEKSFPEGGFICHECDKKIRELE